MNKKIYTALLSMIIAMAYGQKNVGINTDTPTHTLDVNGNMRIGKLGDVKTTNIPLAWNTETGQIIKANNGVNYPFYDAVYEINMTAENSDYAQDVDLNIDATKYKAVLTQAILVRNGIDFENPKIHNTHMTVTAKNDNGNSFGNVLTKQGEIHTNYNNNAKLVTDTSHNLGNDIYIVQAISESKLTQVGNSYHFTGDFKDSAPIGTHHYSWVINVLIIDKNWVKAEGFN